MNRLLRLKRIPAALLYLLGAVVCVGTGRWAPFFCIGFGLIMGWYITRRVVLRTNDFTLILHRIMHKAVVTSLLTFLLMVIIWGREIGMSPDPHASLTNFGFPLVFDITRVGYSNWFVVMIISAPLLQLMTTIFVSFLTLLSRLTIYESAAQKVEVLRLLEHHQKATTSKLLVFPVHDARRVVNH
jgi:hypothetical protein